MSFVFETQDYFDARRGVSQAADYCGFPAYQIPITELTNTSDCRCPAYRNYSILVNMKLSHSNMAVTLVELGKNGSSPQLRVSIDNCAKKLIVFLNEEGDNCGYKSQELEFKLNNALQANAWHKFALEFTEESVTVYMDCGNILGTKEIDRKNCRLKCGIKNNKIVGPMEGSTCNSQGSTVSVTDHNDNYCTSLFLLECDSPTTCNSFR